MELVGPIILAIAISAGVAAGYQRKRKFKSVAKHLDMGYAQISSTKLAGVYLDHAIELVSLDHVSTTITVTGPEIELHLIASRPEDRLHWQPSGAYVVTQDRMFDRHFTVKGDPTPCLALLDRALRGRLKALCQEFSLVEIRGGSVRLRSVYSEEGMLKGAAAAVGLASMLSERLERAAGQTMRAYLLQNIDGEDFPVRDLKLRYLMSYAVSPSAQEAARYVQANESDLGLLLAAARVLNDPDQIKGAAEACLDGEVSPKDRKEAALALSFFDPSRAQETLIALLPDLEVLKVLGRIGTVAAVPALSLLKVHKKEAKRAIEAIQARARGAGDGHLSLVEPEAQGQLSLQQGGELSETNED